LGSPTGSNQSTWTSCSTSRCRGGDNAAGGTWRKQWRLSRTDGSEWGRVSWQCTYGECRSPCSLMLLLHLYLGCDSYFISFFLQ
jgi:hypothetical protein